LWIGVRKATSAEFDWAISQVGYDEARLGQDIEKLLSRCHLFAELNVDARVSAFLVAADAAIADMCRFIRPSDELPLHQAFLRKVGRRSTRLQRTQVFTTNYDLCFEYAASQSRFVVVDGFSHTQPQNFDGTYFSYDIVRRDRQSDSPDFIPNVIHLYKLHGSVDWRADGPRVLRDAEVRAPVLIYPRDSKYRASYAQPFVELMARFQLALRERNTALIVVGFGFNDDHLVEPMLAAIQSNVSLRITAIAPALRTSVRPMVASMAELSKRGDSRIALLSGSFEDLVGLLPDLVPETAEEQHIARIKDSVR
jgi:hypothetical protein